MICSRNVAVKCVVIIVQCLIWLYFEIYFFGIVRSQFYCWKCKIYGDYFLLKQEFLYTVCFNGRDIFVPCTV